MSSKTGAILAFTAFMVIAVGPVMANEHLNEQFEDESAIENNSRPANESINENEDEGSTQDQAVDPSPETQSEISEDEAKRIARKALSREDMVFDGIEEDENDGTTLYALEFKKRSGKVVVLIVIDGSDGEVIDKEVSENLGNNLEIEAPRKVPVENIEEARQRIEVLRETIIDLRTEIAEREAARTENRLSTGADQLERQSPFNSSYSVNKSQDEEENQEKGSGFVKDIFKTLFG